MNTTEKNQKEAEALSAIFREFKKAELKHPSWPSDILHQIAIVNEEAGEATRASLQYVYEGGNIEEVKKELRQTGAMCIRMLVGLAFEKDNPTPQN